MHLVGNTTQSDCRRNFTTTSTRTGCFGTHKRLSLTIIVHYKLFICSKYNMAYAIYIDERNKALFSFRSFHFRSDAALSAFQFNQKQSSLLWLTLRLNRQIISYHRKAPRYVLYIILVLLGVVKPDTFNSMRRNEFLILRNANVCVLQGVARVQLCGLVICCAPRQCRLV